MNPFEQACIKLRHSPQLKRLDWLWHAVRPIYDRIILLTGRGGLKRVFNGTDEMLIAPELRGVVETYEPEVWRTVMTVLRPGSLVVEAGSHIGLYAVTMAKRVGPNGRIFAAEPDPANLVYLRRHVALNEVEAQVRIVEAALSEAEGETTLHLQGIQSQIRPADATDNGLRVRVTTIDAVIGDGGADLILIDVEGFELPVLKGAARLLSHPTRPPQLLVIEVHPYAWNLNGTTSEILLQFLNGHGYEVNDVSGAPVTSITTYGHVIARKRTADGAQ